jgi:TRAP-type C4-dicarboxylate transport system substrate-binding protein
MQAFEKTKLEVLEATGGEVQFKVYPSGVLGEEKDFLFKIKVGQIDGAGLMGYGITALCPDARAIMFPLILDTYEEADAVLAALTPHLEAQSRQNGFAVLGWTEVGFGYLFSTVPVQSMQNLRGAKPWSLPNEPLLAELFNAGNVGSIPVPVGDVLTALQTGLIQTIFAPPLAAVAMQWFTKIKYRNELRLAYGFGGLFVAARALEKVKPEHQEKITAICRRNMAELTQEVRKSNAEALRVMEAHAITNLKSSPEDIAEFRAVSQRAHINSQGKLFSAEAAALIQQTLEDFRAKHPASAHGP